MQQIGRKFTFGSNKYIYYLCMQNAEYVHTKFTGIHSSCQKCSSCHNNGSWHTKFKFYAIFMQQYQHMRVTQHCFDKKSSTQLTRSNVLHSHKIYTIACQLYVSQTGSTLGCQHQTLTQVFVQILEVLGQHHRCWDSQSWLHLLLISYLLAQFYHLMLLHHYKSAASKSMRALSYHERRTGGHNKQYNLFIVLHIYGNLICNLSQVSQHC